MAARARGRRWRGEELERPEVFMLPLSRRAGRVPASAMKEVGDGGSREKPVGTFDGILKQEDGYRKRRDIIGQQASNEATVEADAGCLLFIGHGVVCLQLRLR